MLALQRIDGEAGTRFPIIAKTDAPGRTPVKSTPVPGDDIRESDDEDSRPIRCRQCLEEITRQAYQVAVQGAHRHTFANPAGIVFDIGCYGIVTGITHTGPETDEFAWFRGYRWTIVLCRRCLVHLGWRFSALHRNTFYALIIDRLRFPGEGD